MNLLKFQLIGYASKISDWYEAIIFFLFINTGFLVKAFKIMVQY